MLEAAGLGTPGPEAGATLQAWRASGAARHDPLRFVFIEALARRAALQHGATRALLDKRVQGLLAEYQDALTAAQAAATASANSSATSCEPAQPAGAAPGPLAELLQHIDRASQTHATAASDHTTTSDGTTALSGAPELKTLRYFRSTWSRLSADQRLTQSLARLPQNAGPLHSQQLVHRTLSLMRELSPEYLGRFMAYADALLWLDQAQGSTPRGGRR